MGTVSNAEQDAKSLARRVDRTYIYRPDRFRRLRRGVILLCCVGALVAWGAYARRGDGLAYSPGPVTSVHALWNADCSWCHEPKKEGGFDTGVSDTACLRCHDATIHHKNQVRFIAAEQPGARPGAGIVPPGQNPPPISADCKSCHLEHRGRDLMIGRIDAKCTQCHANLAAEVSNHTPRVHPVTTAFASGGVHPEFGRNLAPDRHAMSDPKDWRDPTAIRYDHARHQSDPNARTKNLLPDDKDNCTSCHRPLPGGGRGGDIGPVNYDRDCAQCHKLELSDGIVIPHKSLDIVRPVLAGFVADPTIPIRESLNAMSPETRKEQLATVKGPMVAGRPKTLTPEEQAQRWVSSRAAQLMPKLKAWYENDAPDMSGFETLQKSEKLAAPFSPEADTQKPWANVRMVEFYVAHAKKGSVLPRCNKCHDLSDEPPAVARLSAWVTNRDDGARPVPLLTKAVVEQVKKKWPLPATQPATAPVMQPGQIETLSTLPTGFDTPRRWFTSSKFDHRAHRSMTCVDCHGQAKTSHNTSDVLLPSLSNCVQCHAPQPTAGSLAGGAGTSCLACHDYHQRVNERSPDGWIRHDQLLAPQPAKPPTPATQPAAPGAVAAAP